MCDSSWVTHYRTFGLRSVQHELVNNAEIRLAREMYTDSVWEPPPNIIWKMEVLIHTITRPKNAFHFKKSNGKEVFAADRYARMVVAM
jgi:hypothetical protein